MWRSHMIAVVALNRTVGVARVRGPRVAIDEIERIRQEPSLQKYNLPHAALGALWRELAEWDQAREYFRRALERQFQEQQLVS